MYAVSYGITAVYLLCGTGMDIYSKKLPRWYLLIGTIAVTFFRFCIREYTGAEYVIGAAAGLLFGAISFLTKEQFGYGDSWMIGILGIFLGVRKLVIILFLAFFASALAAGYWMIWKKCDKHKELPFYPFLCLGYMGGVLL